MRASHLPSGNGATTGRSAAAANGGATSTFLFSIALGFVMLDWPHSLWPVLAALASGTWIWTRPEKTGARCDTRRFFPNFPTRTTRILRVCLVSDPP